MSASFISVVAVRAEDTVPTSLSLCCNACGWVITTAEELLCEAVPCLAASVWSYELDLLDGTAACYSATNPDDHRFDVVRFSAAAGMRLRHSGAPQKAHSWFPPFGWVTSQCQRCPQQLGWVFMDEAAIVQFAGVIVTHTIERRVPKRATSCYDQSPRRHVSAWDELMALLGSYAQSGSHEAGMPEEAEEAEEAEAAEEAEELHRWGVLLRGDDEAGAAEGEHEEGTGEQPAAVEGEVAVESYCVFCGAAHPANPRPPSNGDLSDGGSTGSAEGGDYDNRVDGWGWAVATPHGDQSRAMCVHCGEQFEFQRYGGLEEWVAYSGPADGSFWRVDHPRDHQC